MIDENGMRSSHNKKVLSILFPDLENISVEAPLGIGWHHQIFTSRIGAYVPICSSRSILPCVIYSVLVCNRQISRRRQRKQKMAITMPIYILYLPFYSTVCQLYYKYIVRY